MANNYPLMIFNENDPDAELWLKWFAPVALGKNVRKRNKQTVDNEKKKKIKEEERKTERAR